MQHNIMVALTNGRVIVNHAVFAIPPSQGELIYIEDRKFRITNISHFLTCDIPYGVSKVFVKELTV